ncbi:hypothetical protein ACFVUP_38295 [Streptomyces bacillaris]|uniref:hypothetical protein n=1 Tax=Streptomyces bacillaris TaxID=68179 RepID=UPI0036DF2AEA
MTIKKRLMSGAVATALAVGGLTMVASPAQAIVRTVCGSHYLNLVSGSTTCWGNAGYASVTLYGVYSVISGDNAGYVSGSGGTRYFAKWGVQSIPTQTISGIRID